MNAITLLVADDEPIVRTFLRQYVRENGLPVSRILEAANGQEAIELALEHSPDLILMDIRMPGVNGLDAAAAIMKERPAAAIVMATAYDDFEYARGALRSGVKDYLLKPLDPAALADLIRKALAAKQANAPDKAAHPLVAQVREYVAANLGETLRLEDIARAAHVSPSHCSRVFSRHAGMSISDFAARQRLAKAKELLESTHLPVTEIAGRLGFSTSAYFASWFKRMTGTSPLGHRKVKKAAPPPFSD
ncbi:putative Uncharacterized response regulatory protein SE_0165 [uncultured delta proteobacterium]|uniref:Putative Uncharacterized response regulatory protein SE_0165 n=1 Tax=uncultured delta proteobacterium TaxID=34034 RepID=A0A212IWY3_9DELT|nr:putative Uncharacterized response regulatory protein SE_0165 [uncultured delta proteobacterium]